MLAVVQASGSKAFCMVLWLLGDAMLWLGHVGLAQSLGWLKDLQLWCGP